MTDTDDIDLSGIHPSRWPEAMRRISILDEYLGSGPRTDERANEYAVRLGTSKQRFIRLASLWCRHRDPTELGVTHARGHEQRGRVIPEATRQAISDAIATVGSNAGFTAVRSEAARRCAAAGTPVAADGTIHGMLRSARAKATSRDGEPALILGRVWVHLPVITAHMTVTAPELVLAVAVPERIITAHRLAISGSLETSVGDVTRQALAQGYERDLIVDRKIAAIVRAVPEVGGGDMRDARKTALLTSWLGSRIDHLPIRHRDHSPGAQLVRTPIPAVEACAEVERAVAHHNAKVPERIIGSSE